MRGMRTFRAYGTRVSACAAFCFVALPSWTGAQTQQRGATDGDAIAIVNGTPISRQKFVDTLIEAQGVGILQQMIILELARQETGRLKLRVVPSDVTAEYNRSVNQIAVSAAGAGSAEMDESSKRKALEALLQQKGLSMAEFMITMERNAHLRAVAGANLTIDERLVREEFARQFGEKVRVRHIQLSDLNQLAGVNEMLREGKDFADVARRFSRNVETAPKGGELPPFAFREEQIPAALRDAAFTLKPDEVSSPVRVENVYHILKLERRIPPAEVRYEEVREQVEAALREKIVAAEMSRLATALFEKASVRVLHPRLREEYEKLLKESAAGE